MRIFIIEDDSVIREELARFFEKYGYDCETTEDFRHADAQALASGADLILLDVGLPFQDGYQICRRIRARSAVPIIVLTARNTDFDELLARIERLLARSAGMRDNAQLSHKGLTLDLLQATASHDGREVALTKNEFTILRLLMMNQGSIIPRDAIIDALWQSEAFIDENTLNVNIARLRRKLAEIGLADYLQTKRGMGYLV